MINTVVPILDRFFWDNDQIFLKVQASGWVKLIFFSWNLVKSASFNHIWRSRRMGLPSLVFVFGIFIVHSTFQRTFIVDSTFLRNFARLHDISHYRIFNIAALISWKYRRNYHDICAVLYWSQNVRNLTGKDTDKKTQSTDVNTAHLLCMYRDRRTRE